MTEPRTEKQQQQPREAPSDADLPVEHQRLREMLRALMGGDMASLNDRPPRRGE